MTNRGNGDKFFKEESKPNSTTIQRLISISKELEKARQLIVTGQTEESHKSLQLIYDKYRGEKDLVEILDSVLNAVLARFDDINEELLFDKIERGSPLYMLMASICDELEKHGNTAAATYILLQLDKRCGLESDHLVLLGQCLDSTRSFSAADDIIKRLSEGRHSAEIVNQERYATLLGRRGRREEAIAILDRLIANSANPASLYNNRACILATYRTIQHTREAIRDWKKAEKHAKGNTELKARIVSNLANEYRKIGNCFAAERELKKAIELDNDQRYWLQLGITLLDRTRLQEGWDEYEARLRRSEISMFARKRECIWNGEAPSAIGTLHCVWEQGLGDTVMMARFVPMFEALGYKVILYVQDSLFEIAERSNWSQVCQRASLQDIDRLIMNISPEDRILPIMSAAYALKKLGCLDWCNGEYPYLEVDKDKARKYRDYLEREKRIHDRKVTVGFCWQGNPRTEVGSLSGRSATPQDFAPILQNRDYLCIPLHKKTEVLKLERAGLGHLVSNSSKELPISYSLDDLAALLSVIDVVVTVDTAVAHLSGSLGAKTLVLLHDSPDWRWGRKGEECVFYPTLSVLRQENRGVWTQPVECAAERINIMNGITNSH